MARQIGTVLGVAGLVAILSRPVVGDPVTTFKHALLLVAWLFAGAAVVCAALLATRPRTPASPSLSPALSTTS